MDFTNVTKALTARGFKVSSFETAKEAAEYLNSQIDGATVGFGGSITLEELGLYALAGGLPLWANFLLAVLEEVESAVDAQQQAASPRVAYYMERFAARR